VTTAAKRPAECSAPFVLVPQYFGSTVFDRSTSKYLPFDQPATELLDRLRGEPFDAVLAAEEDDERRRELTGFFEDFYGLGFFSLQGRFLGTKLDVDPAHDHLTGPLAVHLEIAAACNLTCTHCFAGELPRRERALTLEELDRLFATLAAMGAFRLGLTGGEPLLRRDLFEIIDLAADHGLHPCITTNALLMTEQIAREFGRRELVWLNVSLEGATDVTNDAVRGRGTFDRVLENLAMLARHSRFTLAFTVMRSNLAEMEQCAELACRVGAQSAVFRPLYPVGTARHHLELMPTFAEYSNALERLSAASAGAQLCAIDPFGPQVRAEGQAVTHSNHGCGAGNQVCSISISGDVNPCSFLGSAFVAGNIRERPFPEIWHNSHGFARMRNRVPAAGQECGSGEFCGGCRARALAFNGSVDAPDPWVSNMISLEANGAVSAPVYHPLTILQIERRP
jgi:radical SAM protein with 4Fe4S-binding SPASM domain